VKINDKWSQKYIKGEDGKSDKLFTSEAAAKRAACAEEDKARTAPRRKVLDGSMTFRQWTKEVNSHRNISYREQSYLRLHIMPQWGDMPLRAIDDRDDVQEWVWALMAKRAVTPTADGHRQAKRTLAPGTVHRIFYEFSGYMKLGVKRNKIGHTPCQFIDLPKLPPPDERFLTEEEYAALYEAAPDDHMKMLADLGTGTGCRYGEMSGVHRRRIDTRNKVITVHETWDNMKGTIKGYPKSGKRRGVPITAELAVKLDRYMKEHPAVPCAESHVDDQGNVTECMDALLFARPDGRAIPYDTIHYQWTEMVTRAKLGRVRIHDMRHTYASWCIQRGVSKDELCQLLGHCSVIITERYAHLAGKHWDKVRAVLGDAPVPPVPPTPTPDPISAAGGIIDAENVVPESAPPVLPADGEGEDAKIIPFRRSHRSAS
jgi:integrase